MANSIISFTGFYSPIKFNSGGLSKCSPFNFIAKGAACKVPPSRISLVASAELVLARARPITSFGIGLPCSAVNTMFSLMGLCPILHIKYGVLSKCPPCNFYIILSWYKGV